MYYTLGVLHQHVKWHSAIIALVISFIGNWAGTHFGAFFCAYLCDIFDAEPYRSGLIALVETKNSLNFGIVFLRAIPANFLVCSAIFFNVTAEDLISKLLALWFPVTTFAAIGYEHCIANMYFVPLGIFYGANVNYGEFIYRSLIPSTLGNIVGGALFMGFILWYIYLFREDRVPQRPPRPFEFKLKKWSLFKSQMLPK
jgi:formate/nitrite transporter